MKLYSQQKPYKRLIYKLKSFRRKLMRFIKKLIKSFLKKSRNLKRQDNFERQHNEFNAYCARQYIKRV